MTKNNVSLEIRTYKSEDNKFLLVAVTAFEGTKVISKRTDVINLADNSTIDDYDTINIKWIELNNIFSN